MEANILNYGAVADGITWSASASGLTYKGFVFESASSLKPVK